MHRSPAARPPVRRLVTRLAALVAAAVVVAACSSSANRAGPTSTTNPDGTTATTASTTPTSEGSSSTASTSTTSTLPPTTTTTIVTTGGIVMVANASSVNGAAGRLADLLAAKGFTMRKSTNAAGIDENLATSKIYVIAGSEPVAKSISALMGGVPMFRMPTPAWIDGGTAGLGDATVLVMLGDDRAANPLVSS